MCVLLRTLFGVIRVVTDNLVVCVYSHRYLQDARRPAHPPGVRGQEHPYRIREEGGGVKEEALGGVAAQPEGSVARRAHAERALWRVGAGTPSSS